jgi:hypothetical protein
MTVTNPFGDAPVHWFEDLDDWFEGLNLDETGRRNLIAALWNATKELLEGEAKQTGCLWVFAGTLHCVALDFDDDGQFKVVHSSRPLDKEAMELLESIPLEDWRTAPKEGVRPDIDRWLAEHGYTVDELEAGLMRIRLTALPSGGP